MMTENTKLGKRYYLGKLGFWDIPSESRVSVFCDKNSRWTSIIPDHWWTQRNNVDTYQTDMSQDHWMINLIMKLDKI